MTVEAEMQKTIDRPVQRNGGESDDQQTERHRQIDRQTDRHYGGVSPII